MRNFKTLVKKSTRGGLKFKPHAGYYPSIGIKGPGRKWGKIPFSYHVESLEEAEATAKLVCIAANHIPKAVAMVETLKNCCNTLCTVSEDEQVAKNVRVHIEEARALLDAIEQQSAMS